MFYSKIIIEALDDAVIKNFAERKVAIRFMCQEAYEYNKNDDWNPIGFKPWIEEGIEDTYQGTQALKDLEAGNASYSTSTIFHREGCFTHAKIIIDGGGVIWETLYKVVPFIEFYVHDGTEVVTYSYLEFVNYVDSVGIPGEIVTAKHILGWDEDFVVGVSELPVPLNYHYKD